MFHLFFEPNQAHCSCNMQINISYFTIVPFYPINCKRMQNIARGKGGGGGGGGSSQCVYINIFMEGGL